MCNEDFFFLVGAQVLYEAHRNHEITKFVMGGGYKTNLSPHRIDAQ